MSTKPTTRAAIRKRLNRVMRDLEEIEREVVVYMDVPTLDLVSTREAAEILGIKPNTVSSRLSRGTFPEPKLTLASGPIWLREDIEHLRDGR